MRIDYGKGDSVDNYWALAMFQNGLGSIVTKVHEMLDLEGYILVWILGRQTATVYPNTEDNVR